MLRHFFMFQLQVLMERRHVTSILSENDTHAVCLLKAPSLTTGGLSHLLNYRERAHGMAKMCIEKGSLDNFPFFSFL